MVDLSSEEEPCATAALRIAVNAKGRVMGVSKAGSGGLDPTHTQVREGAEPCVGVGVVVLGRVKGIHGMKGRRREEPGGASSAAMDVCLPGSLLACLLTLSCAVCVARCAYCRRWWKWLRNLDQASYGNWTST